jgi:hypothetical protein
MKAIGILFVALALFQCSCHSLVRHNPERASVSDSKAIIEEVYSYMVTNAATDLEYVRFVELQPDEVERLRERCGNQFSIFGTNKMEYISDQEDYHLHGSKRTGSLISVGVANMRRRSAEAYGSYLHPGSVANFRYRLVKEKGRWRILSSDFESAS